jgi:sigma-B regulation protein RsbU (phosphoserine phosphatase)
VGAANKRLTKALGELTEKDRILKDDLEQARAFQERLMPKPISGRALAFAAFYHPAEIVGGDLYDICEVRPSVFRVLVVDATGHGVQASLRTMALMTEYDRLKMAAHGPDEVLQRLNHRLVSHYDEMGLVCTACCFDVEALPGGGAEVRYANAAHLPLLHLSGGQAAEVYEPGTYLGVIGEIAVTMKTFRIEKGDRLLTYTDGLVEEEHEGSALFPLERLSKMFGDPSAAVGAASDELGAVILAMAKKRTPTDDITLVAIECLA